MKETFPILLLGAGQSENVRIEDNLFCKEGAVNTPELVHLAANRDKPNDIASIKPGTLIIRHNAFVNWTPTGDSALAITDKTLPFIGAGRRTDLSWFTLLPSGLLAGENVGAAGR